MATANAKHVPPSIKETAFNCPHCGAFAHQAWNQLLLSPMGDTLEGYGQALPSVERTAQAARSSSYLNSVFTSICRHCDGVAIWINGYLIWPQSGEAPPPNPDLPDDVRTDYAEDRATAATLFNLVNLIADDMISKPKHLAEMFAKLPEDKRKAIARRDAPPSVT